ncbi:HPr kinase/phosphorylase [uncultured Tateyamaria sp.]|uniref:HPr kinase/phosphorylase n=1 Tax=uncultured Tateyamaria sp. TaxID=455651 RepID=UPI0026324A10|nr:HPr kinase/phosphatase C-terminal domain-containing protein [uncultured Tateyamaria sp.]
MVETLRVHASAVALGDRGVLITGASGTGKSSLALSLMAYGATLVADDQTDLWTQDGALWARAPHTIEGLIEARGTGLLTAEASPARMVVVVDMDKTEQERLPQWHEARYLGHVLPVLHKVESPAWPAAILQYLKGSRRDPH